MLEIDDYLPTYPPRVLARALREFADRAERRELRVLEISSVQDVDHVAFSVPAIRVEMKDIQTTLTIRFRETTKPEPWMLSI